MHVRGKSILSLAVAASLIAGVRLQPPLATGGTALARPVAQVAAATVGSLVPVTVAVPAGMRGAPFNVSRTLNVPRGFGISVYARIPGARFMVITPDGNLLVSSPTQGKIVLVRPGRGGEPIVGDFATGLSQPQGMVFHAIGGTTYLYVGEVNQIDRYTWHTGDLKAGRRQVIIGNLPSAPTADGDTHMLKDLVFGPNNKLYVSLGSSCNACTGDRTSTPERAAIYQYNADGSGGRLFARGLRNAEGLAFVPGTATLWITANERDNIAYPYADATGQYGKVVRSYVDNHPPDEFTSVRQGGDYGWPYCNPNPAGGYDNMPFDADAQYNQTGTYNPHGGVVNCQRMDRIVKGIQAHSAPLGLTFLQSTKAPRRLQPGAVIALHGSWDRSVKTGYKVIYFPWLHDSGTGHPGTQEDLVTGWLDSAGQNAWDRPVDLVVDPQGHLLLSADASGTIYKLTSPG
ncbi:MAG TPA: sugar dehydrogenase [Chloroflexota bacterium]|jgi:glucose/arabinose dehydrogenase|nr:sugar dehydrogenase [Chloroflexota bacterium]